MNQEAPGRPRHRRRRLHVRIALLVLLCMMVGGIAFLLSVQSHLANQVQRIGGVFEGLEHRPDKPVAGPAARAMNILVMGTDRRSDEPTTGAAATEPEWIPGAQRTDTIMVLHLSGDRESASLISIPRDSWVHVPGYGSNKINAAFSLAGPSLAVETVEQLTGVRIDHLAVIDWAGFRALIDVAGGVEVNVPRTVVDSHNNLIWEKGQHQLDGERALLYVRQRHNLPGGDLDRVRHQQAVVRGLMRESLSTLHSASPFKAYELLDVLTSHVSVDAQWSLGDMRSLTLGLRSLRSENMRYLTVPVRGLGWEGDQSVVYLDRTGSQELWDAVREDQVTRWAGANAEEALGEPVS